MTTKVKCDNVSCRYSKNGYCKRFEISLEPKLGENKILIGKVM